MVETQDAQRFAEQMGVQLFETSAKDNQNIEEVSVIKITEIVAKILVNALEISKVNWSSNTKFTNGFSST